MKLIVVLDGPGESTLEALSEKNYSAIRVLQLDVRCGASGARNCGVKNARGAWVAFLDDDDEWLPRKLEFQMQAGLRSSFRYPIVFSRVIVNTPRGNFLMPRRGPTTMESGDEYLYCRKSLLPGEVFFHTSNVLIPRELFNHVEFRPGQRIWDDVDWLLRAGRVCGTGFEFLSEVLSIWNTEDDNRPTTSSQKDWKYLFDWATNNRSLFSPRAYSGVLLINIMHEAVDQRDRQAILTLVKEACRTGKPDLIQSASFLIGLISLSIPRSAYQQLKLRLRKRAPSRDQSVFPSP